MRAIAPRERISASGHKLIHCLAQHSVAVWIKSPLPSAGSWLPHSVTGIIGPNAILDREGQSAGKEPRGAGACPSTSLHDRATIRAGSLVRGSLALRHVPDEPRNIGAAQIPHLLFSQ